MKKTTLLRCNVRTLRYTVLMVLFLLSCQSALSQSTDGQLWDNLVSDNNRPSGIMTNQQGNYVITLTKAEHLAWYAWKLNTETNTTELSKFSHAEVKLGADIDLNGHSWRGIGESSIQDFQGTFDGQGHTIRNMICDRDNGEWASGLFDNILSEVEIKNVRFSNCQSRNEKAVGIVAGSVTDGRESSISNVKFTNIVIDSCSITASEWNAGFVVGDLRNAKNVAFSNITVRNCKFGAHGSTYGGIVGGAGWGDCSMSVNNCFISVRNESGKANYRTGGILGYMDYSSNLDVDNCVIDMYEGFFTDNHDQGAIVGAWGGTSKPKASHVLVVANPKLPNGLNVGLFAGWCGSSSAIELSDCFINHMKNPELNQYQIVSKQIADKNRCLANNIMDINEVKVSSYEASCVVKMNRNGACFGINPSYTEEYPRLDAGPNDFVLPLDDPSKGKLLGFEGRGAVSKIFGGVASDFTITPDFTYGVMAQGQTMYYTVKDDASTWVIADNTTNMTDKKRTDKWTFSGVPTDEGELKFTIVERPKIHSVDNECSYNTVTQRVTLKWQVENADVFKKHWKPFGKWNIYRNDVLIDSLDADKDTWTDFTPVNGDNVYKVFFVSNDFMYDKEDNKKYFTKNYTSKYDVHLTENSPVISNGKVVNTVGIPNTSILNGSRIRLLRWDTVTDSEKLEEIIAKASQLKVVEKEFRNDQTKEDEYLNVSFEDEMPVSSMCTNYYYLWLLDNINDANFNGKTFHTAKLQLLNDAEVKFKSFSATKGKNASKVSLKWNTENKYNESLRYVIERKIYGKEDKWISVHETTSGLESGSYDDEVLPGYVYNYRIRLYPFCESLGGIADFKSEASDIGFAASRGTIQGRVTFNSGKTNVEGVDVRLQSENNELAQSMTSYAMQFTGSGQTMPLAEGLDGDFWNGEWTLQFLLRNDSEKKSRLLTVPGEIYVNVTNDTTICLGSPDSGSDQSQFCIHVNYGTYEGNYIILQHNKNGYRLGKTMYDNAKQVVNTIWTEYLKRNSSSNIDALQFGYKNSTESFLGAVDEIRLWEGNLSDKSIADTYNRYLSGNEKGLMAYYTFDSGVGEYAFDSSHPSGNWNNRDVALPENRPALTSIIIPESSVLAYRGITDKNGEYTISGIPFEGEGTNWQIVPSYGAHDFSPVSTRRLVSTNTLVHTGIDFTDISSFKVKGKVYYEHTNIPVQGCNIMIDGVMVNEGKQNSETNSDGEFSVDVPIGTHTLSMSMTGHTFTDSLTMYFNKEVHDLWFYDKTKAIVAGRIVGGELEYAKLVGLAQSKNNIGTAYITLKPANDNYYFTATTDKNNLYIVPSTKQIDYDNPLKYSNDASAHTGKANSDTDMGDANRIYIKTDSQTGEFAAFLPPMRYEVIEIKIPTADEDVNARLMQNLDYLDARNTTQEMTDSVWKGQTRTDGEKIYDKFTYNTIYRKMVSTPAVLEVWQTEEDKNFFGEDSVSYIGNDGKENVFVAYSDGQYTIGAEGTTNKRPVFNQFGDYVLYIKACQKYVNKDDGNNILIDEMPMAHKTVSISNAMSYENYWYVDENGHTSFEESEGSDFELDSLGCGVYKFRVGVPNTTAPFEETLSMAITGEQAKFNLTGIVFGAVSYGNSFVTRGPDVLSMILRDPPGSKSYATWTKGSTVTTEYRQTKISESHSGVNQESYLGFAPELEIGSKGKGKYGIQLAITRDNVDIEGDNTVGGFTQTITTTQDISTSSAPEFDGPDADLFIGSSVNSVSGNGKQVTLLSSADGVRLGVRDVKTSAFTFNTSFVYSQYQIKKSVIPNLLAERRKLIEDPATLPADNNLHYVPKVDFKEWQAMTDEEKDRLLDKGAGEGYEIKTYVEQYATDSVNLYKVWADDWKNVLRRNEKAKVDAFAGNYIKGNYTFDAGSSQTFTTSTNEMNIIKDETDLSGTIDDIHAGAKAFYGPMGETTNQNHTYSLSRTETRNHENKENKEVLSFTLAENGANDILTVDRMTAPDGFSDIFRTRSGQTSAFWAPKYVTEYYQPGTEIMAPTLMVNKPKLELVDPTQQIISNVRRGTAATIQFRLINESEAKCNGYYRVCLEAESNRNGARCTLNGNPMNNEGVLVWLEYGQPQIVTVNVEEPQNPVDGTHKLKFYLIDDKQTMITGPMKIYPSEVEIQVDFVKTSSEINLVADKNVINGESVRMGNGKVRFTLKDYDLNMENLLYIDLQQWNGTRFISLGESARWEKKDGLTESVDYTLDMSDISTFPDKEYRFRARTVSNYGEGDVEAYSDEIVVMKDVSAPQPVGNIRPLRGVFNNSSEISVEFNEDIDGDIRKHTNVELYGELLQNASAREVSVFFNGKDDKVSTDIPVSALQDGAARSFNLWLKWMGGEGTILSLGTSTNSNRFEVDAEGHFIVSSNNDQLVSVNTLEKDKWMFLSLVADATVIDCPASITASYILEDGTDVVWLIGDKDGGKQLSGMTTPAAPFVLGKGFHGYIQDLSMWDGVRDMETSNNEKSIKKTRFTPDLMAYWPLNEGKGTTAKEVVSEQNMYLSSEDMWSIENKNYAVRLEKGQKAQLVFSRMNTNYDEDYLLQAWFNVDKNDNDNDNENDVDTLISYPNGTTCFVIQKKTGKLVLKCKKDSVVLGDRNIADGHWHQLSFMVKNSENGNAVLYLDGNNVGQISAKKVDAIQGVLFLGDKSNFSGYFDEIRIWNGLQNSQAISENINNRYSTTDCPIAAYFPFEVSGQNQAVSFTLGNYGNMKAEGDTVRLVITDPNAPLSQQTIAQETEIVPPLKNVPTLVTRDFSIKKSERKIWIELSDKEKRDIQGTTLTALLRGLHDKAGNTVQDIRWSFFVEMNDIEWTEFYTENYNKNEAYVGYAQIRNNTGTNQSWQINGAPDWMELSIYDGVIKSQETITISIKAKENIPIGINNGMLSLIDANGISHKKYYSISNIPNSPSWTVDSLYSQVMTVTGQVRINNVIQENDSSKLAAFNTLGKCIGVATPKYTREKNSYYYTLMIYGNEWYIGKEVTFKFYDASTGTYYASVEPTEPILFGGDYANIGSIETPIYWDITGKIEQIIDINKGWNWISFNTQEESPVEEVFENPQPSTLDPQPSIIFTEVKDKNNFARYYNGKWEYDSDFGNITYGRMYKVKAECPAKLSRIGKPANDLGNRISIAGMTDGKPGWSWIGANINTNMPLTTAMGGLTSPPKVGDVIKNYNQFAEYTTSGWIGDLNTIIPGKGYMYMSNDEAKKYLIYPYTDTNHTVFAQKNKSESSDIDDLYAEYAGSATMIAAVESDGIRMTGCRIYAIDAEGNIHGNKEVISNDNDNDDDNRKNLAYLVIHGNEPETIGFKVVIGEGDNAQTFESTTTFDYYDGLSVGTSSEPFVIKISGATGINNPQPSHRQAQGRRNPQPFIYNIGGVRVNENYNGVVIKNGKKQIVRYDFDNKE